MFLSQIASLMVVLINYIKGQCYLYLCWLKKAHFSDYSAFETPILNCRPKHNNVIVEKHENYKNYKTQRDVSVSVLSLDF